MSGFSTRTKIISGAPIEAGGRRFLPSVLVTTLENDSAGGGGIFHITHLRPISVVEQGAETQRWHTIPDATQNALSQMAAVAFIVAALGVMILALNRLARE